MKTTRSRLYSLACIVLSLTIAGCSTLSKQECLTVDWRTIGYEDGTVGYAGERIARHRKACAKHGVTPDLTLYQAGREQGLREFCQPTNGFRLGTRGYSYSGVCAGDLEPAFLSSYEAGRHLYVLQARVGEARSQLESKVHELNSAEDAIARKSAFLIAEGGTAEERAQAIVDTKQLAEKVGRLKEEIRQLEQDRARYEHDVEEYRNTLSLGS